MVFTDVWVVTKGWWRVGLRCGAGWWRQRWSGAGLITARMRRVQWPTKNLKQGAKKNLNIRLRVNQYAPRYGTRSQGTSLLFYLHTPRSSANELNHTCLFLPSRSWYSFTDPGGMEDWVGPVPCPHIQILAGPSSRGLLGVITSSRWKTHTTAAPPRECNMQLSVCVLVGLSVGR